MCIILIYGNEHELLTWSDSNHPSCRVLHHDGFVIYQSRYTDHGIMSSPFMNGKGDIVRELSESCAKYGIKLAVYLSPADLWQMEDGNLYGNGSPVTMRTIPKQVEGRPFAASSTISSMTLHAD